MQRNDRSYKDLKQKQKSAIADKTYKMHLKFYLENQRMPDAAEMKDICKRLFVAKGHRKTPEEKAAVAKQKKQQRRARRKQETRDNLAKEEILQDDRFFVIAGYTSGGAPYGVTWEEKDLKPWEDLEENE